jgi:hypothetical protein
MKLLRLLISRFSLKGPYTRAVTHLFPTLEKFNSLNPDSSIEKKKKNLCK